MRERDLQRTILDYLKLHRVFYYRQNTGVMRGSYKGKSRFVRFGAVGAPDIVAVIGGKYVGIEVKARGGLQTDAQNIFQRRLEAAGGEYLLVRSFEEFEAAMAMDRQRKEGV